MMRSRPPASTIGAVAVLAVFTVWITWRAKAVELRVRVHDSGSELQGRPAPDFKLTALDGRTVSLADYRGKQVALSFWASWCGPCRMELPVLRRFYEQTHKTGTENFEILAISLDTEPEEARIAARELKLPFPVLLQGNSGISETYHIEGIPALFVVDPAGKVTFAQTGFSPGIEIMLATQLGIKDYNPMAGFKTK